MYSLTAQGYMTGDDMSRNNLRMVVTVHSSQSCLGCGEEPA